MKKEYIKPSLILNQIQLNDILYESQPATGGLNAMTPEDAMGNGNFSTFWD